MLNFEEILENLNEINVDNVNQVEKLGEGSLGTVYKLQNSEYPIAIKCMKNAKLINELVSFERDAYHKLGESSINVIKYYDIKERIM